MSIERVSVADFAGEDGAALFARQFVARNRPCLVSGVADCWRATREWVTCDGLPDWAVLRREFGNAVVPVVSFPASSETQPYGPDISYGSGRREDVKLATFVDAVADKSKRPHPAPYCKDWHFMRDFPSYGAYETPAIFRDDWLNWWWDAKGGTGRSDYRFVYIGPAGTWTPLHHDVFMSNSWSANVCGRKRWLLFSPAQSEGGLLRDELGNLVSDARTRPDAMAACADIIQEPGEAIFVPSGWHHQVHNLVDTISINHNWFNANNIRYVASFLRAELDATREAIRDCRQIVDGFDEEWEVLVQRIMRSNCGCGRVDFARMLRAVAEAEPWRADKLAQQAVRDALCVVVGGDRFVEVQLEAAE